MSTYCDRTAPGKKKQGRRRNKNGGNVRCQRWRIHFRTQASLPNTSDRIYSHRHNNRKPGSMKSRPAHNSTRIGDCPSPHRSAIHLALSLSTSSFVSSLLLTLNLSFFAVGPPDPKTPAEVPLIDMIIVSFFSSAN